MILLVALFFLAVFEIAPSAGRADEPLPMWDPAGIEDFELEECRGRKVTKADLVGKPWLAAFIFTKCAGPCPLVSGEMKKLQEVTKDLPWQLVSFTVDPTNDTPEVLRFYADNLGADPDRWWFLTGDKATIFRLVRGSFRMIVDDDPLQKPGFEVIHSIEIMHVDAEGVVVGRYNARNELHMARLKRVVQGKMTAAEAQRQNALPDAPESDVIPTPDWVRRLPNVNAMLNGLATVCLLSGYVMIRYGRQQAHISMMLSAFVTSTVFLGTYLTYHFALKHYTGSSSQPYQGPEALRIPYYCILIPHIILAPVAAIMAVVTIILGWKKSWAKHKRLARITFPIWLFVSVTGVVIYFMVYILPKPAIGD